MANKLIKLLLLLLLSSPLVMAQHPNVPNFTAQDIGDPKVPGETEYDLANQAFTLTGSGYNIWYKRDEFHYASTEVEGDFIATANFMWIGEGTDPHRKTGWMMRTSLNDKSAHATAALHGDGLTVLQWRPEDGASMRDPEDQAIAAKEYYDILQLERKGNTMIMRGAIAGEMLQEIGEYTFESLPDKVHLGLFVCAHNEEVLESARVWNVRVDKPVGDDYNPNEQGWLQSRLEVMDVFTGSRSVVHTYENKFEAPNWMPDGNRLLYNQEGLLYTIGLNGQNPEVLNTGEADNNNNDHGISFDGKLIALSHHRPGFPHGGSTIYVVPITGGTPKRVTQLTPSYWHGWAPDNKHVLFVARREHENYDIYRANIDTGQEERLTTYTDSHSDGPEYSPDGNFIYYNASPTGTMQLWRMRPDGSDKTQLTFDEYNDWFPHISPDGKWIAFLSFPSTINPDSHPSYKRVVLRLMPVAGGPIRTIAYLFGGQGTINVPSWAPDSKRIAFVSYTR